MRRKKKVEERKKGEERKKDVKDEDLYGGSTDENTDAEAEENKPIPELPGVWPFNCLCGAFLLVLSTHLSFCPHVCLTIFSVFHSA